MSPEKGNEKERELELWRTEPIPTRSTTAMLIEKEISVEERLPDGEGDFRERRHQHQKGMHQKREQKKWLAEEEAEGGEARRRQ